MEPRRMTTSPNCFECGADLDVAYWCEVTSPNGRPVFRPCCPEHAPEEALAASREPCAICGRLVAHGTPPPGRGTWTAWAAVCSIGHLNDLREQRRPPPSPPLPPRPCEVCATEFQPRRKNARFCGARCRQANHRIVRAEDVAEIIDRVTRGELTIAPSWAAVARHAVKKWEP